MTTSTSSFVKINHHQSFLSKTPEIRIHYQIAHPADRKKGTILLIHGFPESSYQFRDVIPLLASSGYTVIAPDYRGHGFSNPSPNSTVNEYTKRQLSIDLHDLVKDQLNIKEKIHVVGHDIGGMIAHAYVAQFPSDVESVIWGECPLPGSTFYDEIRHDASVWHFDFQSHHPDLAVALVLGKEELYLTNFFERQTQNLGAFSNEVIQFYVRQYSRPGALRASFLSYRAFETDGEDNRRWREENGKVRVRSLVLNGEGSLLAEGAEGMAREFYEDPTVGVVEGSGHFVAEENPEVFVKEILRFVGQ